MITGEKVESKQVVVNKYLPTVTVNTLGKGNDDNKPQQPEYKDAAMR